MANTTIAKASYDLVVHHDEIIDPPEDATTPWRANLERVKDYPLLWVRFAAFASPYTARRLKEELTDNKPSRARPSGTWEFRLRATDDENYPHGVEARYLGA